jgi:hypothetical protein
MKVLLRNLNKNCSLQCLFQLGLFIDFDFCS